MVHASDCGLPGLEGTGVHGIPEISADVGVKLSTFSEIFVFAVGVGIFKSESEIL